MLDFDDPRRRRAARARQVLGALASLALIAFGVGLSLFFPDPWRDALRERLPPALARFAPTPAPLPTPAPAASPRPTPTPEPPPRLLPEGPVFPKTRDTVRLANGARLRTALDTEPGGLASFERETPADYALDLRLQVKVPAPARTVAELSKSNPALPGVLPKLPTLLENAPVSKFYHGIYQLKTELLQRNLNRLDLLLAPDTFYDTETVLELHDPESKRRALLIQTRMEVDADGSDADRLNVFDNANDVHFQPLTSFRWPRRNPAAGPSVYLKPLQDRIAALSANAAARRENAALLDDLRLTVGQLGKYSSLIARTDPFIVLPGFMVRASGHPYQPKLGDHAAVISGNRVFPAIFGDVGPTHKLGEASLRLAQAIDPKADANHSPVDNLQITYVVFPNTADPTPGPPDLPKMRARCQALLAELGGLGPGVTLHEWENLLPPAPTPTPSPTATTTPTPTPTPSPTPTPTKP